MFKFFCELRQIFFSVRLDVEYKVIADGTLGKVPIVKVYNLKAGGRFRLGDPGVKPDGFDGVGRLGDQTLKDKFTRCK